MSRASSTAAKSSATPSGAPAVPGGVRTGRTNASEEKISKTTVAEFREERPDQGSGATGVDRNPVERDPEPATPKTRNLKTTVAESREKRPNWRTGAPCGNRNAVKTGCHTAEMRAFRREVSLFLRRARMHREALKLWRRLEKSALMLGCADGAFGDEHMRPPSVSPALRASEPPSPTGGKEKFETQTSASPLVGEAVSRRASDG